MVEQRLPTQAFVLSMQSPVTLLVFCTFLFHRVRGNKPTFGPLELTSASTVLDNNSVLYNFGVGFTIHTFRYITLFFLRNNFFLYSTSFLFWRHEPPQNLRRNPNQPQRTQAKSSFIPGDRYFHVPMTLLWLVTGCFPLKSRWHLRVHIGKKVARRCIAATAAPRQRRPENVAGNIYVDTSCIDCDT